MKLLENLKKAIEEKKPLKITMYDNDKGISDTDIYRFIEGKYRGFLGMGFEIEEILKEINNSTWLKIEVAE